MQMLYHMMNVNFLAESYKDCLDNLGMNKKYEGTAEQNTSDYQNVFYFSGGGVWSRVEAVEGLQDGHGSLHVHCQERCASCSQ